MEYEFKVGDEVLFINKQLHYANSNYYPKARTVGTIVDITEANVLAVQWPKGSTSKDDIWLCTTKNVVPFSKYTENAEEESKVENEKFYKHIIKRFCERK